MTKKKWYGGWPFGFGNKNSTATAQAQATVLAPETAPNQSSTDLKDSDFYDALFGVNYEKFSEACRLFKNQPLLNAVFGEIIYKTVEGQTPLTSLIVKNKLEFFNELLKTPGIDVNKQDNTGQTPLTMAAYFDKTAYVKILLTAKLIDVNGKNKFGKTPIYLASENGNADILKLLIEAGGDVNMANKNGTTPLGIAMHKKEEVKKQKTLVEKLQAVVTILEASNATNTYKEPAPAPQTTSRVSPVNGYDKDRDGPQDGSRGGKKKSKTSTKKSKSKSKTSTKKSKSKSKTKSKTKRNKRKTK
jgi:hypothetical protein